MKVRLTDVARKDLRDIREYYLRDSPVTADRVRRSINEAIRVVSLRPEIGLHNKGKPEVRSKLVLRYPYRVHYRVNGDALEILHIRHTARRPWGGEAGEQ